MSSFVLVHGAWHGPWCWDDVAAALRESGHEVAVPTLPGHDRPGTSGRIWNRISQYLATVGAAAEAASDAPILVGHSMGGYVVQRHLEKNSARCGVLVASVPRRGTLAPNLRFMRKHPGPTLAGALLADYSRLVETDALVRELFFTADTPAAIVTQTRERLQNESALAVTTMAVRWPRPERVQTAVEVIGATGDDVFNMAEQRDLAAAYDAQPVFIEGGHDLMLDTCWPELVDALEAIASRRS